MIQIGLTVTFLPNVHFSSTIYSEDIFVVSLKWVIEKLCVDTVSQFLYMELINPFCKEGFAVVDDHTHIFPVTYHHLFVVNVSTSNL
jgi:hypothetical protein